MPSLTISIDSGFTVYRASPSVPYVTSLYFTASAQLPTGAVVTSIVLTASAFITGTGVWGLQYRVGSGSLVQQYLSLSGNATSTITLSAAQRDWFVQNYMGMSVNVQPSTDYIGGTISNIRITGTVTYTTPTIPEPTTQTPTANPPPTTKIPPPTTGKPSPIPKFVPPTPTVVPRSAAFIAVPPTNAAYATNYTLTIDITRNGVREPVDGTMSVTLYGTPFAGGAAAVATWTFNGGTAANTQTLTVTEGRATGTIQFPSSGHTDGNYYFQANSFSTGGSGTTSGLRSSIFKLGTGSTAPTALKFTTQPASTAALGASVSATVSVIDDGGTVVPGFSNEIRIALVYADGRYAPNGYLKSGHTAITISGTEQYKVAAVAGVAAFSGLKILQPGRWKLIAQTVENLGFALATSTPITVQGEPVPGDIVGLRQNVLKDGTLFVGTTGYPTVTANPAISTSDKEIFDGDMTHTSGKTVHGVRYVFPYTMSLSKIMTKFKLNTIASAPLIRVLYSLDTTVGTDGTWTLLASYTPESTSITRRDFQFSEDIFCKGIWVTQDQNGGASTCIWYAVHAYGGYIGSSFSILNIGAVAVDNEGILSIPKPAVPINTATTKTRELLIRHNTSTARVISVSAEPARDGGDIAVEEQISILGSDGEILSPAISVAAYGSVPITLQYSSTAAPTALDGDHIIRVSIRDADEDNSFGAHVGTSIQAVTTTLAGTVILTKSSSNIQTTCAMAVPGTSTVHAVGYNTTATNLTRYMHWAPGSLANSMDVTSPVTESEYTRIFPLTLHTGLVTRNSTGAVYKYDVREADMTEAAWLATAGRTQFTLAATTSGPKTMVQGRSGRIWVANGRAADILIYEMDKYGTLYNTINTATALSGLVVDCHAYDPVNDELYVVTRQVAGTRKISRYNASTLAFIASVNNSDEGGTGNAEGCGAVGNYFYVYYDSRYLNRYDLQTLANNVRKYDNGAASYADSNWKGFI